MEQQEQAMVEVEKKQIKVMVAIDESEGSFHALKWVLDHLFFFLPSSSAGEAEPTQNQEQGRVILLHVQQPFQHYVVPVGPAVYATTSMLESIKSAQQQNSAALMARALKLCNERRGGIALAAVETQDRTQDGSEQWGYVQIRPSKWISLYSSLYAFPSPAIEVKAEAMILNGEPKEMICQAAEQIDPTLLVVGSRGLGKIKRAFLGSVSDYCGHHAKCPILIVKPLK